MLFSRSVALIGTLGAPLLACGHTGRGSASCGIAALTQPLAVKQAFSEGNALPAVPELLPNGLVVRLVAGPAWHATVARDSAGGWTVTTHGKLSKDAHVGYGVLVVDDHDAALGVLAFDGHAIPGAAGLGTFAIGDTIVPLLGVRMDAAPVHDPKCPVFPDSLR